MSNPGQCICYDADSERIFSERQHSRQVIGSEALGIPNICCDFSSESRECCQGDKHFRCQGDVISYFLSIYNGHVALSKHTFYEKVSQQLKSVLHGDIATQYGMVVNEFTINLKVSYKVLKCLKVATHNTGAVTEHLQSPFVSNPIWILLLITDIWISPYLFRSEMMHKVW